VDILVPTKEYYKVDQPLNASAFFKFLNDKNEVIPEGNGYQTYAQGTARACYGSFFAGAIPQKATKILVFHTRPTVPYTRVAIKRYIDDLNELGFPCHYMRNLTNEIRIEFRFKEYKYKVHLLSALTLIRVLWEHAYAKIPEIYFQAMDANPKADKFEELQKAHKKISNYGGHTVTGSNIKTNATLENYWKVVEHSRIGIYDAGNPGINKCWGATGHEYA
jgi:hypothetical protein